MMAMTSSMTRTRSAEGPHQSHPNTRHSQLVASAKAQNTQNKHSPEANPHRTKRLLDNPTRDPDARTTKKPRFATKIAVEIPARHSLHSVTANEATDAQRPIPEGSRVPNGPRAPYVAAPDVAPSSSTHQNQQRQPLGSTKHKEKVVNGLKHELNNLQPNPTDPKDQGRKLRSQEAIRFKSDLSAYFPDYDEVIGNEPKEQRMDSPLSPVFLLLFPGVDLLLPCLAPHFNRIGCLPIATSYLDLLNIDTPILVFSLSEGGATIAQHTRPHPYDVYPVRSYGDTLFTDLWDSQRIDFGFLEAQHKNKASEDPLPDSLFEPAHKKSERLERSIRNLEKGRAQHEKDQIIRLLEGLQGHDWLRVMGVSGVTESRKKTFEPARKHFIKGCEAILEKFRTWTAEEKRRKLVKERAAAEAEAEAKREAASGEADDNGGEDAGDVDGATEEVQEDEIPDSNDEMQDDEDDSNGDGNNDNRKYGDRDAEPPDESDVDVDIDASIAKQLREDVLAAKAKYRTRPAPARRSKEPEPHKEFTSFFAKKYQRDAALSRHRRRNRSILAWGQPVPEVAEANFELPCKFLDQDTLRSHARRKRRSKRGKQSS